MGGRGSSYFENKTKKVEAKMLMPPKGKGIKLPDDPESERKGYRLFSELKKQGFSTRLSTDSATLEQLQPHQGQLLNLANKYSKQLKTITKDGEVKLGIHDVDGSYGYWCSGEHTEVRRIALSSMVVKRNDTYVKKKYLAMQDGKCAKVDERKLKVYTTTHEFGHCLEESIMRKRYLSSREKNEETYEIFRIKEAERIKNKVVENLQKKYTMPLKNDMIFISTYAEFQKEYNCYFEWFAETFTNLELSSKPTPIAKELGEYLKGCE